jgi:hypothetical protein
MAKPFVRTTPQQSDSNARVSLLDANRPGRSFPSGFLLWLAGKSSPCDPESFEIPATYGLEGGLWLRVEQGFRGILVQSEAGEPHVYVVREPPTRYYRVMTRGNIMPCLIDEVIRG